MLNDIPDPAPYADADFAFGGGGLDVLNSNTAADRLIDWNGEFNTYLVPFSAFGIPTETKLPSPAMIQFLFDLSRASGADQTVPEPNGEIALVQQSDPQWGDQKGNPRDPQSQNTTSGPRDGIGGPEDDSIIGGATAAQSTVSAAPASVVADGSTTSTVTVILRDINSNPVSGKAVTLSNCLGLGHRLLRWFLGRRMLRV